MAYSKHTWVDEEVITKEKLNNMEDGIESVEKEQGPAGAAGKDGLSITSIKLTMADGVITSGEATMSDASKIPITVEQAGG